ncbi:hypothetical protein [Chitinophaga cymbidii]|uniref:Secretion system C-terminal sorting domain-containing protein n=1 Tax=Chitinophaga cymbidii TaxID=1096750 RepID=A0A512RHR1_9BACT|nr:hypothetical protein [Chitinophaga cymbidii]GEP95228.1 hypothetical protein CCY01nite_14880 [Chitinophaga cymbidii]
MKHSFVFSPKHLLTVAALALSLQAAAQQETFAYAGGKGSKTKAAPVETNDMIKKGYKLNIQQENVEDLRFVVQIDNPAGEKLTLFIRDANNNTLHKEVLDPASPRIVARYKMDKLDDGAYTFEIRNGKSKLEKAIDIRTETIINRVASVASVE